MRAAAQETVPAPEPRPIPESQATTGTRAAADTFAPAETRTQCMRALNGVTAKFIPISPISEDRVCGHAHPVMLVAVGSPSVHLVPRATVNCPLTGALSAWMQTGVQEAAMTHFGEQVVAVKNVSSYVCRARGNQPAAKMSEHAFANALDIAAFRLKSGRWITVADHWTIASAESQFLKAVHRGACALFTTVLGPNANTAHRDHFHLDLGKHGQTGTYRICE